MRCVLTYVLGKRFIDALAMFSFFCCGPGLLVSPDDDRFHVHEQDSCMMYVYRCSMSSAFVYTGQAWCLCLLRLDPAVLFAPQMAVG